MILPNLIFDITCFGLLAAAVLADALMPATHGAATLIVLGFIVFLAAEDAAHHARRLGWGQESFASGFAVSLFGFIYYWWRNDSDAAATALHICLMLSALMVLIGVVSAGSAVVKERSARPIAGLLATACAGLLVGLAGGLAVLFWTSAAPLVLKLAVVLIAFGVWRLAQQRIAGAPTTKTAPAAPGASAAQTATASSSSSVSSVASDGGPIVEDHGHHGAPRVLRPAGGTALDRAVPLLLLGALAASMAR